MEIGIIGFTVNSCEAKLYTVCKTDIDVALFYTRIYTDHNLAPGLVVSLLMKVRTGW